MATETETETETETATGTGTETRRARDRRIVRIPGHPFATQTRGSAGGGPRGGSRTSDARRRSRGRPGAGAEAACSVRRGRGGPAEGGRRSVIWGRGSAWGAAITGSARRVLATLRWGIVLIPETSCMS